MAASKPASITALVGAGAFDAVFKQGQRHRSARFALHYLQVNRGQGAMELAGAKAASPLQIGFIIPKRLAKRAARRNQIRRIWRECLQEAVRLGGLRGQVVVRLVQGFAPLEFKSSASTWLAGAVRQEALTLLGRVAAMQDATNTSRNATEA
jgi:ribonuclease P protein component